jgi:hypothetical protein
VPKIYTTSQQITTDEGKMKKLGIYFVALMAPFFAGLFLYESYAGSAGSIDHDGEKCRRNITFDSLSASEKKSLTAGDQVLKMEMLHSGYMAGYIFKLSKYDPEFVLSVYSKADEHAGENGMGSYIVRSDIKDNPPGMPLNFLRVEYEQNVPFPGIANGVYTVENEIVKKGSTYHQDSKLIDSEESSFSPRWFDGYFTATSQKVDGADGTFVVTCHYMVPRSTWFKSKVNDMVAERMGKSGVLLMRWADRVAADADLEKKYRERLRGMIGKPMRLPAGVSDVSSQ